MRFTKHAVLSRYIAAIAWFSLTLLIGCSDDDHKKPSRSSSSASVSSSSSSSAANSSSSSSIAASPYAGEWYAPAYGYVLSVSTQADGFRVKTYSVTEDYCLLQNVTPNLPQEKFEQSYAYSKSAKETLRKVNGQYAPGVEFEKIAQLPSTCTEDLQTLKTDSGYAFNAERDFEIFWHTFNELYINFELRGVDWDDAYKEAVNSLGDIHTEEELFEFLSELIAPLGDGHAILIHAPLSQNLDESITKALEDEDTPNFSTNTQLRLYEKLLNEYVASLGSDDELTEEQAAEAENYIASNVDNIRETIFGYADENADIKVRAAGEIAWFTTSDNIGYLFIGSMSDYTEGKSTVISDVAVDVAIAEETINEALKDLEGTEGLIIDVRFNGGGQDQVSLSFVRHFMSQPQVVYSKFAGHGDLATPVKEVVLEPPVDNLYLKPTAVLVSGDTGSAAELFTIAMSSLPQVTIIGEPTAGAFSDVLVKRLTSDIIFGISNETYLDTKGNNYEGVGIATDISVAFGTLQERKGGYDNGLDTAIDWIKAYH